MSSIPSDPAYHIIQPVAAQDRESTRGCSAVCNDVYYNDYLPKHTSWGVRMAHVAGAVAAVATTALGETAAALPNVVAEYAPTIAANVSPLAMGLLAPVAGIVVFFSIAVPSHLCCQKGEGQLPATARKPWRFPVYVGCEARLVWSQCSGRIGEDLRKIGHNPDGSKMEVDSGSV